jgi:hypothetical protein
VKLLGDLSAFALLQPACFLIGSGNHDHFVGRELAQRVFYRERAAELCGRQSGLAHHGYDHPQFVDLAAHDFSQHRRRRDTVLITSTLRPLRGAPSGSADPSYPRPPSSTSFAAQRGSGARADRVPPSPPLPEP